MEKVECQGPSCTKSATVWEVHEPECINWALNVCMRCTMKGVGYDEENLEDDGGSVMLAVWGRCVISIGHGWPAGGTESNLAGNQEGWWEHGPSVWPPLKLGSYVCEIHVDEADILLCMSTGCSGVRTKNEVL